METIPNYEEIFETKNELHKLLRRVVVSTKLGRQHRQPDDDIELDIGNGSLGSCGRYQQVRYYPKGVLEEYELDHDLEALTYLMEEIKKRFQEFRKSRDSNKLGYINGKKKFARKFFDLPLIKIEEKYGDKK